MKKSRFTEEQIIGFLKQVKAGIQSRPTTSNEMRGEERLLTWMPFPTKNRECWSKMGAPSG